LHLQVWMQNLIFKAILLIMTVSSLDTYAENKCHRLFSEKPSATLSLLRSDEAEYKELQDQAQSIASQIKKLYTLTEKSELSDQIVNDIYVRMNIVYIEKLKNFLNKKNIEFKIIKINDGPEEHLLDIAYPIFIIQPTGSSKLNKYAAGLNRISGIGLVYSPPLNKASGFTSAFIPSLNSIILHDHAVLDGQFSDSRITTHEIKHSLFQSERNGNYKSKIKAPVHGFFKNSKIVTLDSRKPYQSFFSFEELVTYAYSITADAKKIRRIGPAADRSTLNRSLEIMASLSARTMEMSDLSLYYLDKMQNMVIDYDKSLTIRIDDHISLTLQIPISDIENYKKDPLAHAKKEFQKIKLLAEFNLSQIQKINLSHDHQAAIDFRSAQVQFLESLTDK
jgi:hypothetical protein